MSVRDSVLLPVDKARSTVATLGLRRYAVTVRRRVWSGSYPGDGTPTDQDIVLTPTPRVRNSFSGVSQDPQALQYEIANGNIITDRYYRVDKITPAYLDAQGNPGGYTPQQLRTRPSPDATNVEQIVVLVGDDGLKRDCTQESFEMDRAFGYAMLVKETDRPRAALQSVAITPGTPSIARGTSQQLKATGTFVDNDTSDLTPLMMWQTSDPTITTVDLLGKVTGVAAGTATVTASLTGVVASITVTVT